MAVTSKNIKLFTQRTNFIMCTNRFITKKCPNLENIKTINPLINKTVNHRAAPFSQHSKMVTQQAVKDGSSQNHFKSMWSGEIQENSLDEGSSDRFLRFDEMYYKPSDKSKIDYQQTWVSVPQPDKIDHVLCSFENLGSKNTYISEEEPNQAVVPFDSLNLKPLQRARAKFHKLQGNVERNARKSTREPQVTSTLTSTSASSTSSQNRSQTETMLKVNAPHPSFSERFSESQIMRREPLTEFKCRQEREYLQKNELCEKVKKFKREMADKMRYTDFENEYYY